MGVAEPNIKSISKVRLDDASQVYGMDEMEAADRQFAKGGFGQIGSGELDQLRNLTMRGLKGQEAGLLDNLTKQTAQHGLSGASTIRGLTDFSKSAADTVAGQEYNITSQNRQLMNAGFKDYMNRMMQRSQRVEGNAMNRFGQEKAQVDAYNENAWKKYMIQPDYGAVAGQGLSGLMALLQTLMMPTGTAGMAG